MKSEDSNLNILEFESVLHLIQEAKNRIYARVNAELVLLYFNVGKIVSEKIDADNWCDKTVIQLANFITARHPESSGFNRRGLYRMRQFYETYGANSECFLLWLSLEDSKVSPTATLLQSAENEIDKIVSLSATLLEKHNLFLKNLRLKISWTNHLEIFSSNKKVVKILFYNLMSQKNHKQSLYIASKTYSWDVSLSFNMTPSLD